MKQSSIEWLINQLEKHYVKTDLKNTVAHQQAKAMHKEEIDEAYANGSNDRLKNRINDEYYNETFNTEECYHKGKYTYNKETFECHKCGLIVPNEYRFNSK